MDKEQEMITSLNNVIEMDHPNIHKTHEYYNDSQFHYILSDFCSGGDLFPRILNMVPFTEKIASGIMKQLIGAVQGCHMNKTVHMDIKSDNILFSSPGSLIKIGDFGLSKEIYSNDYYRPLSNQKPLPIRYMNSLSCF